MKHVFLKVKRILVDLACEDELPLDMTTFDSSLLEPASSELIADIEWKDSYLSGSPMKGWDGMVNGKMLFAIDQKGKRKVTYVLKSYPFESGIFTKANNSKVLFEDESLAAVIHKAEDYLKQYVNLFLKQ